MSSHVLACAGQVAILLISFRAVAAGDITGVDGHGPLPPSTQAIAPPLTLTQTFGIEFLQPPQLLLSALDCTDYLTEDQDASKHDALRISVARNIDLELADGQWVDVQGGRLWRVEIKMLGALSSRLYVGGLHLEAGQLLALANPGRQMQLDRIVTAAHLTNFNEAWGICDATDLVRLEWFVPEGQSVSHLPFKSVRNFYGYRPLEMSDGSVAGGQCSNNPACYPQWQLESDAACWILYNTPEAGWSGSGQLLATVTQDETPYVATANHVVSNYQIANSCQFRFFWRSPCIGQNLSGIFVFGADLAAVYEPADSSLLLIRGALPAGVQWVGWTADNPVSGGVTGIHHPAASAQAISFANLQNNTIFCSNEGTLGETDVEVRFTLGVTLGGSSGSGLYRNSDHRLCGVLACGGSSCSNPNAPDVYGRWAYALDPTRGNFSAVLTAGADDLQEGSDTCLAALSSTPLAPGSYGHLVVKRLDQDWYKLTVPVGEQAHVRMSCIHADGDVELELYRNCTQPPLVQSLGDSDSEEFHFTNTGPESTLYLRVFVNGDTRANYSLAFNPPTVPSNDFCQTATAAIIGQNPFDTSNASTDGFNPTFAECGVNPNETSFLNDVWFNLSVPVSGELSLSLCQTLWDTRLEVYSNCSGSLVACNDDACGPNGRSSALSFLAIAQQVYKVRVGGYSLSDRGAGTLMITEPAPGLSCNVPLPLQVGTTNFNRAGAQVDQDYAGFCDMGPYGTDTNYNCVFYKITPALSGLYTFSTCNITGYDTRLSIQTSCNVNSVVACNDDGAGCGSYTSIMTAQLACGVDYIVAIGGYDESISLGAGSLTVSVASPVNCSAPCPGDFNGDRIRNGLDLAVILSGWGAASGDLNSDGTTNGLDLAIILSGWGACPN